MIINNPNCLSRSEQVEKNKEDILINKENITINKNNINSLNNKKIDTSYIINGNNYSLSNDFLATNITIKPLTNNNNIMVEFDLNTPGNQIKYGDIYGICFSFNTNSEESRIVVSYNSIIFEVTPDHNIASPGRKRFTTLFSPNKTTLIFDNGSGIKSYKGYCERQIVNGAFYNEPYGIMSIDFLYFDILPQISSIPILNVFFHKLNAPL